MSIQWKNDNRGERHQYLSQEGLYFSFDEAYRSETGKNVPAHLYISQGEMESIGLDVRDRTHADQIVATIVGVDDENQLLVNPELTP